MLGLKRSFFAENQVSLIHLLLCNIFFIVDPLFCLNFLYTFYWLTFPFISVTFLVNPLHQSNNQVLTQKGHDLNVLPTQRREKLVSGLARKVRKSLRLPCGGAELFKLSQMTLETILNY